MDITLPVGSWLQTNEGHSVSWALPDHTDKMPQVIIYKRRPHSADNRGYSVKDVFAGADAVTGVIRNSFFEFSAKLFDSADPTVAAANYDALIATLGDADVRAAVLSSGQIPNGTVT